MTTADIPTREQLARRAAGLRPVLHNNAAWQDHNRRLHDETIEALAEAEVFRLRDPKRYGGHGADARTLVDVGGEQHSRWQVKGVTGSEWKLDDRAQARADMGAVCRSSGSPGTSRRSTCMRSCSTPARTPGCTAGSSAVSTVRMVRA